MKLRLSKIHYVLIASLVANAILGWLLYGINREDPELIKKLERSNGRVEVLTKQYEDLVQGYGIIQAQYDSVKVLADKEPEERVIIKKVYDEKISGITTVSADSSIKFFAGKLSTITFD